MKFKLRLGNKGPSLKGVIAMWSGLLKNIPAGWALCDGENGTPDLRDMFIKGSAAGVDPGVTGGANVHKHNPGTYAADPESGGTPSGAVSSHIGVEVQAGIGETVADDQDHTFAGDVLADHSHSISGDSEEVSNEPVYFSLAFIMNLQGG